ncbi:MAG: hypothetical protein ABEJ06_01430 [Haloarculaceae archaeon]
MEASIVEQVESWESEPFSGGYGGLHDLADREFTGAVATGDTYLFVLNGRAIGVFDLPPVGSPDGELAVFEGASGTVYEAPHLSLPLLFTMYLSDGEVRAQYYTEDTDIEEVDQQLSEGGFTGYIELSENVLSGDYYVVYQAGRSMSAAFVGASGRLYTDEEAFDRAADEVGIYDVVAVDVEVLDIPEPSTGAESGSGAGVGAGAGAAVADADGETTTPTETPPAETDADEATDGAAAAPESDVTADERAGDATAESTAEAPAADDPDDPDDADGTESAVADTAPDSEAASDSDAEPAEPVQSDATASDSDAEARADTDAADDGDGASAEAGADTESEPVESESAETSTGTADDASAAPSESADAGAPRASPVEPAGASAVESTAATSAATDGSDTAGAGATSRGGEEDLAVRSVPALDPELSGDGADSDGQVRGIDARDRRSRTRSGADSEGDAAQDGADDTPSEEVASLRSTLAERESRIEELEADLAEATDRGDRLREERDRLREERDELEATVQRLRERIDELESQPASGAASAASDADAGGPGLAVEEALAGTDLFVRYRSKSQPTLEAVADGAAKDDVTSNLQLERHTRFDDVEATVEGQPYDEFLRGTLAYRFVRWAIEDLVFEVRETGHTASLSDLYEVLPAVDRAELQGSVTVETDEGSTERSFDVVLRDRMGDPLVVANLDTSRQPTGRPPMRSLIEDATVVAGGADRLSAAFFVTSSFFESDALETARDETGTGLLSRDKRRSVVKLSRKRGYHLCLVEARDESFHLTVPDL